MRIEREIRLCLLLRIVHFCGKVPDLSNDPASEINGRFGITILLLLAAAGALT
jgi:hypothetical protein